MCTYVWMMFCRETGHIRKTREIKKHSNQCGRTVKRFVSVYSVANNGLFAEFYEFSKFLKFASNPMFRTFIIYKHTHKTIFYAFHTKNCRTF